MHGLPVLPLRLLAPLAHWLPMDTPSTHHPLATLGRLATAVGRAVLRLALLALGLLLVMGALLVATVLAAGAVVWALVRGRRPQVAVLRTRLQQASRAARKGAGMPGGTRGDVIDVEVRELR
jgi:hypothetical protein